MGVRCGGWRSAALDRGMRGRARLSACLVLLAHFTTNAWAEPETPIVQTSQGNGWTQVWSGVDAHSNGWLIYGGTTVAPFTDIYSDGLRLRATTGYGGYGWQGNPNPDFPKTPPPTGHATTNYADALVGYYTQLGPVTIKLFGGIAKIEHNLGTITCKTEAETNCDSEAVAIVQNGLIHGMDWGPKASFEVWLNIGSDAYASFDASYTTAFDTYGSHLRLGYRLLPTVSAGIESAINGNFHDDNYRGGMFVRYEWSGGEITVSGGIANSDLGNLPDSSFYGTANYATRF
jgi:hypothetical protein